MKDLLLCERKVGELTVRAYRLQEQHLIAVWGLPGAADPKRLGCHDFEHLNDLWMSWQQMDAEKLTEQLTQTPAGMLPKPRPKIVKRADEPPRGSDRPRSYGGGEGGGGGGLVKKNRAAGQNGPGPVAGPRRSPEEGEGPRRRPF